MFEGKLDELKQIFETAPLIAPGRRRPTDLTYKTRQERTEHIDRERRDIIGDFESTLDQCRVLLNENAKYTNKNANFFENAQWHYGGNQEQAMALQARLQFHAIKVSAQVVTFNIFQEC